MANHNAEYDIENNSSYLESRLMGALVEKGIVDKPKTRIFYDPENFGEVIGILEELLLTMDLDRSLITLCLYLL